MTFWRRFRLYLLGVGLGLLLVFIFFGQRDWTSWTPEGRVMMAIDSSAQSYSERAICQLKCLEVDSSMLFSIQESASVDFSESSPRKKPCPVYRLRSEYEEEQYVLIWKVCEKDEAVELLSIIQAGKVCGNCD
ncbi:MAG: hypothetical protein CMP59_11265 [Flavobacteriales bacterium]|nr:hypothetical protein [Flavobacteriales bacterium]|tara:strand:+ start:438 stop:836 length:399 start_codon:yes stop_codon:yes gene_type:complete